MLTPPRDFQKQIIDYWQELKNKPKTTNEILNEKIKMNTNIRIGNKTVNISGINKSNKTIVKDFMTDKFTLKSKEQLLHKGVIHS